MFYTYFRAAANGEVVGEGAVGDPPVARLATDIKKLNKHMTNFLVPFTM